MFHKTFRLLAGGALLGALLMGANPAAAQGKKLVIALPGIPPIFSVTIAYVAEKQGFFKKHGVDVEIRPFDNGTAAARAVVAGDIDMAWSPTPPVINQISNAGVPLVGLYGMPNPDWVIGASETGKTCKDLAGQDVGVDSINGARSVALRSMLTAGCPGMKIDDVKQIALGSGPGPALIAGRLHYAVLHLDDLAEIQSQGKKLNILLAMKNTNPTSHYLMLVARKDNLAKNRDAIRARRRRHDRGRPFHAGPEKCRRGCPGCDQHRPQRGSLQGGVEIVPRHRLLGGEGRRAAAQQARSHRQADEENRCHQARQGAGDL